MTSPKPEDADKGEIQEEVNEEESLNSLVNLGDEVISQLEMANDYLDTYVKDELKKLVALRDSGVLSDEEFEAQKAKLLG